TRFLGVGARDCGGPMSDARRFTGGRVFTGHRFVEAILVEDGRVTSTGSATQVARDSPTGCEVERLSGRLVLPGLIDAHLHLPDLTRAREGLALDGTRSREELVERLLHWAEAHPNGPIVGRGWDLERFPDRKEPTRRDLEMAVADRPVVLFDAGGHTAVANRAALEAVGYMDDAPDPPGGKLGRGPDGGLDGLLRERALEPVARFTSGAFPPEPAALARTLTFAASLGLTSVATLNTDPEELAALAVLARDEALPVRVRAYLRFGRRGEFNLPHLLPAPAEGSLAVRGVKMFTDGAFGPRTAWLSQPYADRPEQSGNPTYSPDELARMVGLVRAEGWVPALHAIGDRALGAALTALEGTRSGPLPSRIEHASLVPPELYPALDRVRPALVVQPGFVWSDAWLGARLGPDRVRFAYPFRTLTASGHLLVGSSDAPYDPVDPWRGLAASTHRVDPDGGSANPDPAEALSPAQAVQLYTSNAGRGLGEPDLGHLEPGARADLLVHDAPDLGRAIGQGAAGVAETWLGGRRSYRRREPVRP
ncbi:MAG: amidohydrolase, partial [Thermoplasmata archaeon]|nr:amidohydrolase [Thermoplasmata archaeon]